MLIDEDARKLMTRQQAIFAQLREELTASDILVLNREEITEDDKVFLQDVFLNQVFPVLSPLAIDPAHPFPFIPNTGYSLALELERKKTSARCKRSCRSHIRSIALSPCPALMARSAS